MHIEIVMDFEYVCTTRYNVMGENSMINKTSEAELLILEYLWEKKTPATFSEILNYLHEKKNKDWKKQTVSTFLLRLVQKGLLFVDKSSRKASYSPALTSEEFYQDYANWILDTSFGGSLKNFIAAFTGNQKLSHEEKDELIDYIERL